VLTAGPTPAGETSAAASGPATRATLLLIALRTAYAYNWFSIGPALPSVSAAFAVPPSAWGGLIAAFLVGAGALQVPSGLLARRYGTRSISLLGALLLGVAAAASAFAPSYDALLLFRGLAGAGAGLFFSPAIALVGSLHPEGHRGVPVGIFSSAFSAGAGLGIFGSALLIPWIGWRGSLLFGGVLLLALLLPALWAIPASVGRPATAAPRAGVPFALRSPAVWAMGLAFIGLEGASLSAGQYFVPFAESVHGWTPAVAGAIGALFVFPSFFGGPVGGRLTERSRRRRTQMVLATAVPAVLILLVPYLGLAGTAVVGIAFSLCYGMVYAMMYVLAPYLPGLESEEVPLAIGLFNGIQLSGGAAVAFAVAYVVGTWGYSAAWTLLGVATMAPLAILAAVPRTGPSLADTATAGRG
jgi:MFS transporter, ACS family, D-galactonate transporter